MKIELDFLLFSSAAVKFHIPSWRKRRFIAFVAHLSQTKGWNQAPQTTFGEFLSWIWPLAAYCWLLWAAAPEEINTPHISSSASDHEKTTFNTDDNF